MVVLVLLGTAAGAARALTAKPEYEATSQALVATGSATNISDLTQAGGFTQDMVETYAAIARTRYVLGPVIDQLHLDYSLQQLQQRVDATATPGSDVLQITVVDPSPTRAADVANVVTKRLGAAVTTLTPAPAGESPLVRITQVDPAVVADRPVSPDVVLDVLVGALVGLILAVVIAVLRYVLDTRLRTIEDVERLTRRPTLGGIAYDPVVREKPLIVGDRARTPWAEAYRVLRTNLRYLDLGDGSQSIVITSSVEGEGKTTSAANLAIALSHAGRRVLLVDSDLRRPRVAEQLGLEGAVGLTNVLIRTAELDEAIQFWGEHGPFVLPSGRIPPNPSELLQSDAMVALITQLTARFDTVIFDAPPLLPVADAAILAGLTDGAIVFCAARRTRAPQLRGAMANLDRAGAKVLGVVVTMLPRREVGSYRYGYISEVGQPAEASGRAFEVERRPSWLRWLARRRPRPE